MNKQLIHWCVVGTGRSLLLIMGVLNNKNNGKKGNERKGGKQAIDSEHAMID
jgi:hypothetical protein